MSPRDSTSRNGALRPSRCAQIPTERRLVGAVRQVLVLPELSGAPDASGRQLTPGRSHRWCGCSFVPGVDVPGNDTVHRPGRPQGRCSTVGLVPHPAQLRPAPGTRAWHQAPSESQARSAASAKRDVGHRRVRHCADAEHPRRGPVHSRAAARPPLALRHLVHGELIRPVALTEFRCGVERRRQCLVRPTGTAKVASPRQPLHTLTPRSSPSPTHTTPLDATALMTRGRKAVRATKGAEAVVACPSVTKKQRLDRIVWDADCRRARWSAQRRLPAGGSMKLSDGSRVLGDGSAQRAAEAESL
jgi:hypothetical protein